MREKKIEKWKKIGGKSRKNKRSVRTTLTSFLGQSRTAENSEKI